MKYPVAVVIAGIFMAYGANGSHSAMRIATRISGPERGPRIAELCTATVRAVAQGVVGIAFIQMLLIGGGFVVVPALAAVLTVLPHEGGNVAAGQWLEVWPFDGLI